MRVFLKLLAAIVLGTVRAPAARGLVLVRTLIDDEKRLGRIDAARRHAACEPVRG
jgi:uncharacterized membrane protein